LQVALRRRQIRTSHPGAVTSVASLGVERWRQVLAGSLPPESLRACSIAVGCNYITLRKAAARQNLPLTLGRVTAASLGIARWKQVLAGSLPPESLRACAIAAGCRYNGLRTAAERRDLPLTLGYRISSPRTRPAAG